MMLPVTFPGSTSVLICCGFAGFCGAHLIAGIYDRQADLATAPLPGIGLSTDDVSDRPVGVRKTSFLLPCNSARALPKSCDCTTVTTVWGQVDFWIPFLS